MEAINALLDRLNASGITYEPMAPREYEQFKADGLNAAEGTRHLEDGYHCNICKNKGFIVKVVEDDAGSYHQVMSDCKCVPTRNSILRMERSGLKNVISDYHFDKFEVTEPWQQVLKDAAMEYAANPEGWFFVGGQSGAGKTHICTAICREFLLAGRRVKYMPWRDAVVKIKSHITDPELYRTSMDMAKWVDVLFIDDLFKTGRGPDGAAMRPTAADINVAFEILNYRYNNPLSVTIISSELSEDELLDIDEAVGGRICERSKAINITKDRSRNYRTRKRVTI